MSSSWKTKGHNSASPRLIVEGESAATDFLTEAFNAVTLREVVAADLDAFYANQADEIAARQVRMKPRDRPAFDQHWQEALADPSVVMRSIMSDGRLAGNVGSFIRSDKREVCYWIDRALWGRGIATAALRQYLEQIPKRPLYARVAKDHLASLRVLVKCGFAICGSDTCPADERSESVEEWILELRT